MDCDHIEEYFKCGFTYAVILALLAELHGVVLSKRTLERSLSKKPEEQNWCWKNKTVVATFIQLQLETSGHCLT